jgi:hypothetical protein
MEVFYRLGDLYDDMTSQILAEVGQTHDLMEQLAAGTQLQDDVVKLRRLGELDEFDNIWVIQLAHYLDFFQDIGALGMEMTSLG